ncbi:cupin domain-containing protein [Aquicoccus sp. SCR17]|nr:cupin domain-containing protein [Carideicomes alvinocaridis]
MDRTIETRRFVTPDEHLDMKERGGTSIIRMKGGSAGMQAVFEPGWTWEVDETPLLGSPESCPMRHKGYYMSGELVVRMLETCAETRLRPGDFFEIPPGHDAYVAGDERVELILFESAEHQH